MSKKEQRQNGHMRNAEAHPSAEVAPEEQAFPEASGADETAKVLENLTQEVQQTRDQLLRQAAEFQNYRRRTEQERATLLERGRSEVIERMLGVLDNLRRSLDAVSQAEEQEQQGAAYQALKQGIELVYQHFFDELVRLGVEPIDAEGKPFDENLHEAVMQQPAPDGAAPGTVLQEVQRGYTLGNRVLRHSKVIVAA